MSEDSKIDPTYVMGRSLAETERLQKQGDLFKPATRCLLQQAGISSGMGILDVGSGAGDVALLAAELVGSTGKVVGVDVDPEVLRTAQMRAHKAGMAQVSFIAGDIRSVELACDFDAVIGRNVLLYTAAPVDVLRIIIQHLRPGGIVAFSEYDFSVVEHLVEANDVPTLYQQVQRWILAGFRRAGMHMQMGIELPAAFVEAGLPFPQMHLDGIIGTGPDWGGYDYLAETLRNILPRLVEYGIVQVGEVDVDTLSERLRAEVVQHRTFITTHTQVGAWTRIS